MRVINVDLDGVVYPWHEVMALWVWTLRGEDVTTYSTEWAWDFHNFLPLPSPTSWDFEGQWGMSRQELQAAARLGVERGVVWTQGKPIAGSVSGLWRLNDADFYIRLVTQRLVHKNSHLEVQQATAAWLDRWNVPYHEIIYQGNHTSKADFKADYAIDDNIDNVAAMREAGVDAYLLERTWNLHSDGVVPTVWDWTEFLSLVLGEEYEQLEAWPQDQVESVPEGSSNT